MTIKGARSERKKQNVVSSTYLAFEGEKTEPHYLDRMSVLKVYNGKCTQIPKQYLDLKKTSTPSVFYFLNDYQQWIEDYDRGCPWSIFLTLLVENTVQKYGMLKSRICRMKIDKKTNHVRKTYTEIEKINKELHDLLESKGMLIGKHRLDVRRTLPVVKEYMRERYGPYDFEEIIPEDFEPPVSFGRNRFVMVVDRDQLTPGNDNIDQYVKNCKKRHYSMILTNPNFEFWIALHSEDYNRTRMLFYIKEMIDQQSKRPEDRTISGDLGPKKYLRSLFPEYKKNSDFFFITKEMVDLAKERAKQYPSDLEVLKNKLTTEDLSSVGTNVPSLLELLDD